MARRRMFTPPNLYFVDRGERPEFHAAPYHRYLVCPSRPVALWEAGPSHHRACVWVRPNRRPDGSGWLLLRWQGLDVDYGPVVTGFDLPAGGKAGFAHPPDRMPWPALGRAVWWSRLDVPEWLGRMGVMPPADSFSVDAIRRGLVATQSATWKKRYVFPGEEVAQLSDWLDDAGFPEAAARMRDEFRVEVRAESRIDAGKRLEATLFDGEGKADG